jgi:methylase of polypeptide subunit release factors
VDKSPEALAVATMNAERLGVRNVSWIEADVTSKDFWAALRAKIDEVPLLSGGSRACAIISNPPYVSVTEWEQCEPEVRDFEPRMALVPDGGSAVFVSECIIDSWSDLVNTYNSGRTRFFLGMETGIDHPQTILANRFALTENTIQTGFPLFRAHDQVRYFPVALQSDTKDTMTAAVPFVCEDLEGRPRFLFASAVSCGSSG